MGPWAASPFANNNFNFDDPGNLARWEPWCRAAAIDAELLSHLYFTPIGDGTGVAANGATLWYWNVTAGAPPTATAQQVVTLIPPDLPKLKAQLDFVASYADLREDRASEILAQLGPQYAFWSSIVPLHPTRTKWTLELLDTALRLANYVEMRFKHALVCPRPVLLSPQIQPIILTPGHGSLPSGHSTEAHMVASVLWKLCQTVINGVGTGVSANDWCIQLMRQAARIAVNRTVAGVHFPVDSAAGQLLGLTLGDFFIARATGGQYNSWTFDGLNYPGNEDFFGSELFDRVNCVRQLPPNQSQASPYASMTNQAVNVPRSCLLGWLWTKAAEEWTVP